ncbi:MAG: CBS domain-containing protein [Deltaproteobacteria bacterium]|nr:CBS domain-containing protein [Deltaproteobacteria bacterium]MBI4796476.1 CBS domain-containing protein [Deltaproteobacteria bacterium]
MPIIAYQNVLQGLTVQEAMRRQVVHLPQDAPLEQAVRFCIKYKVNALLITGERQEGLGVVSKTDLMGAYYAGLPISSFCNAVMVGPPLFCRAEETLDAALDTMRRHRVHRLYVRGEAPGRVVGVLAYPDIVGLLYRYCLNCQKSIRRKSGSEPLPDRFQVREVMTPEIYGRREDDSLQQVMEGLAAYRFGAVLIRDGEGAPLGVVSKTDLILAYKHEVPATAPAREVMTAPVQAVDAGGALVDALKTMIFADVHRVFVYQESPRNLVGTLSLSDVARFRSGTCRACLISRIKIEGGP